jgi:hypothetical protein
VYSFGGLVGENGGGTITNCYSSGSVFGIGLSCETAYEIAYVGGLVGYNNYGTITNCYSSSSIVAWWNTHDIGGLVGKNYLGTVNNSFWDKDTSGQTTSSGGTGKTTAEMKQKATFDPPWDFVNTWQIQNTLTYPYLHIGAGAEPPIEGDIDGDGDVDFKDFSLLANNWLEGAGP